MALGGWISGEIFDLTQSYYLAFVNGILWNLLNILAIIYVIFKSDLFNKNKLILNQNYNGKNKRNFKKCLLHYL